MDAPVFFFKCPKGKDPEQCLGTLKGGDIASVPSCVSECLKRVPVERVRNPKPMKKYKITFPVHLEAEDFESYRVFEPLVFVPEAGLPEEIRQLIGDQPVLFLGLENPDYDTIASIATDFGGLDDGAEVIVPPNYDPNRAKLIVLIPSVEEELVVSARFLKRAPKQDS